MATAVANTVEGLQAPHGGKLIDLQTPKAEWDAVIKSATKTFEASDRNACDIELLSVGWVRHRSIIHAQFTPLGCSCDLLLEFNREVIL